MALNAVNVPGPDYKMWNTWQVPKTKTPAEILNWVAAVAKGAGGGRLNALVINCHGSPARLGIGTGIGWSEVNSFKLISGLLDDIYIVACNVVSFSGARDGNLFCSEIAKSAGANVFASNATQSTGLWPALPYGKIDGYEGQVWKWFPNGSNMLTDL
jgi:hypothetical protein